MAIGLSFNNTIFHYKLRHDAYNICIRSVAGQMSISVTSSLPQESSKSSHKTEPVTDGYGFNSKCLAIVRRFRLVLERVVLYINVLQGCSVFKEIKVCLTITRAGNSLIRSFAHFAQIKRATVSDSLRSLKTNEQL